MVLVTVSRALVSFIGIFQCFPLLIFIICGKILFVFVELWLLGSELELWQPST